MKKLLRSIFVVFCLQFAPAKAQWVTIPDANFVAKLTQLYPSCMNGNQMDTTCFEIINEDSISIASLPISNMDGIQYFDNLKYLKLYNTSTTSLPAFPSNLVWLELFSFQIPSLPALPNSLEVLLLSNSNQTTNLPALPGGLKALSCAYTQITSLPSLPNTLEYLKCNNNLLTSLPTLPNALLKLYCDDNDLYDLPVLPISLKYLSCKLNYLQTLPALPSTLTFLNCYQTGLTYLDPLPSLLDTLNCGYNNFLNLPTLPTSLIYLNCYYSQLTSLPALPSLLKYLDCSGNVLASFPTWPVNLEFLNCNWCELTSLPPLPTNLKTLICYYNQLTSLPALPNSLENLDCSNNLLSILPALSNSLINLTCNNNQLISLPTLPNPLIKLICNYNQLISLPALPSLLWQLEVAHNQLTSLPSIPSTLIQMYCSYNQLTTIPTVPATMWVYDIRFNNVSCVSNLPYVSTHNLPWAKITDNPLLTCVPNQTAYSLSKPLCIDNDAINNPNNCVSLVNISGFVYSDADNNCAYSIGDLGSLNIPVKLYDSLDNLVSQYYTSGGSYGFFVSQPGTYKVKIPINNLPYSLDCSSSDSLSVNLVSTITGATNNNFPIFCNEGFDAYPQAVTNQGWVFPAQIHSLQTNISNNETWYNLHCDSLNYAGTVTIQLNGPVTYVSPVFGALTPQVNGNTLTYNVSDFSSLTPSSFGLRLMTDTFALAGSQICVQVSIATSPFDADTINNVYTHCYNAVNSYDPNMKEVYPVNVLPGYDDWFTYTIHFQNTGNAPAFNIRLADTLDTNLDINTFEVRGYSHPAIISINGNVLTIRFNNILLPDSTTDYEGSMGYFQYRLKPLPNLPNGTQIENTAYIYFDYNAPIVTNTTQNNFEFVTAAHATSSSLLDKHEYLLYPNPSNGIFSFKDAKNIKQVTVYNLLGEQVVSQTNQKQINLSGYSKGIYFAKINGEVVVKLVKE